MRLLVYLWRAESCARLTKECLKVLRMNLTAARVWDRKFKAGSKIGDTITVRIPPRFRFGGGAGCGGHVSKDEPPMSAVDFSKPVQSGQ